MSFKSSSGSPLNHQELQNRPGGFSRWIIFNQPKRPSAVVRMSLQISLHVRQPFAPEGMVAPSVYVRNLCRPEMVPFSVINFDVLKNIGPFGGYAGRVCRCELCLFYVDILSSATESPVRTSSVGICRCVKSLYRIGELSVK